MDLIRLFLLGLLLGSGALLVVAACAHRVGNRPGATRASGVGLMILAAICGGMFFYTQTVLNHPDHGMELLQFYLPLICYATFFGLGFFLLVRSGRQ